MRGTGGTVVNDTDVGHVGGRIMVPKDVHILILEPVKYVTLHGKRDFADVIKLRILRWRDYSGLSWWAQCNYKCP